MICLAVDGMHLCSTVEIELGLHIAIIGPDVKEDCCLGQIRVRTCAGHALVPMRDGAKGQTKFQSSSSLRPAPD